MTCATWRWIKCYFEENSSVCLRLSSKQTEKESRWWYVKLLKEFYMSNTVSPRLYLVTIVKHINIHFFYFMLTLHCLSVSCKKPPSTVMIDSTLNVSLYSPVLFICELIFLLKPLFPVAFLWGDRMCSPQNHASVAASPTQKQYTVWKSTGAFNKNTPLTKQTSESKMWDGGSRGAFL